MRQKTKKDRILSNFTKIEDPRESHLMGAGGDLGGHHVGDVDAGDEQDESGQETEDAE